MRPDSGSGPKRREKTEESHPALTRRQRAGIRIPERDDAESVAPACGRVPESETDTLGHVRLAPIGRTEAHRRRGVENQPGHHDPIREIDAHVRLACSRGHVPVDPAHIVAHLVGPDLGELGADPEQRGAIVAREERLHAASDREVERAQEALGHRPGTRARWSSLDRKLHAALLARSISGAGTATSTCSRIASGVTSSASAW